MLQEMGSAFLQSRLIACSDSGWSKAECPITSQIVSLRRLLGLEDYAKVAITELGDCVFNVKGSVRTELDPVPHSYAKLLDLLSN